MKIMTNITKKMKTKLEKFKEKGIKAIIRSDKNGKWLIQYEGPDSIDIVKLTNSQQTIISKALLMFTKDNFKE